MGHKTSKGSISMMNHKGRIRLRWRYQKKRYSLNLFSYNKANLQQAKKIAVQSERGLLTDNFDFTLRQYNPPFFRSVQ
jgi:integrase